MEEGGRHKPFLANYTPQFYMRTMDVTGKISLPEEVKIVMPGDNVKMTVELIYPVAMFAITRGGGKGAGQEGIEPTTCGFGIRCSTN